MAVPAPPMRALTLDEARAALSEGLAVFQEPSNKARMEAAIAAGVVLVLALLLASRIPSL